MHNSSSNDDEHEDKAHNDMTAANSDTIVALSASYSSTPDGNKHSDSERGSDIDDNGDGDDDDENVDDEAVAARVLRSLQTKDVIIAQLTSQLRALTQAQTHAAQQQAAVRDERDTLQWQLREAQERLVYAERVLEAERATRRVRPGNGHIDGYVYDDDVIDNNKDDNKDVHTTHTASSTSLRASPARLHSDKDDGAGDSSCVSVSLASTPMARRSRDKSNDGNNDDDGDSNDRAGDEAALPVTVEQLCGSAHTQHTPPHHHHRPHCLRRRCNGSDVLVDKVHDSRRQSTHDNAATAAAAAVAPHVCASCRRRMRRLRRALHTARHAMQQREAALARLHDDMTALAADVDARIAHARTLQQQQQQQQAQAQSQAQVQCAQAEQDAAAAARALAEAHAALTRERDAHAHTRRAADEARVQVRVLTAELQLHAQQLLQQQAQTQLHARRCTDATAELTQLQHDHDALLQQLHAQRERQRIDDATHNEDDRKSAAVPARSSRSSSSSSSSNSSNNTTDAASAAAAATALSERYACEVQRVRAEAHEQMLEHQQLSHELLSLQRHRMHALHTQLDELSAQLRRCEDERNTASAALTLLRRTHDTAVARARHAMHAQAEAHTLALQAAHAQQQQQQQQSDDVAQLQHTLQLRSRALQRAETRVTLLHAALVSRQRVVRATTRTLHALLTRRSLPAALRQEQHEQQASHSVSAMTATAIRASSSSSTMLSSSLTSPRVRTAATAMRLYTTPHHDTRTHSSSSNDDEDDSSCSRATDAATAAVGAAVVCHDAAASRRALVALQQATARVCTAYRTAQGALRSRATALRQLLRERAAAAQATAQLRAAHARALRACEQRVATLQHDVAARDAAVAALTRELRARDEQDAHEQQQRRQQQEHAAEQTQKQQQQRQQQQQREHDAEVCTREQQEAHCRAAEERAVSAWRRVVWQRCECVADDIVRCLRICCTSSSTDEKSSKEDTNKKDDDDDDDDDDEDVSAECDRIARELLGVHGGWAALTSAAHNDNNVGSSSSGSGGSSDDEDACSRALRDVVLRCVRAHVCDGKSNDDSHTRPDAAHVMSLPPSSSPPSSSPPLSSLSSSCELVTALRAAAPVLPSWLRARVRTTPSSASPSSL